MTSTSEPAISAVATAAPPIPAAPTGDPHLTRLAESIEKLAAAMKREDKGKDFWDKLAGVSAFLSTVVLATAGTYFTHVYNSRESARQAAAEAHQAQNAQLETMYKFLDPIASESPTKRQAALLTIAALGQEQLSIRLAALDPREGSGAAVAAIERNGSSEAVRQAAGEAKEGISKFYQLQDRIYKEAVTAAAGIATADSYAGAEADVKKFWNLYWGEMTRVEDAQVAGAMVAFGRTLNDIKASPDRFKAKRTELEQRSLELGHATRDSLERSSGPATAPSER